mgnify:CR=1 FL=1
MPVDTNTPIPELTEKERKNKVAQHNQLRPLARRADLWEDEEYSSEEYERMMEMYNGTLASIDASVSVLIGVHCGLGSKAIVLHDAEDLVHRQAPRRREFKRSIR